MNSKAATVTEYLAGLPADRREALEALRKVIKKHLPKGCEEGMQYGMIGYYVPHKVYPPGYHCDTNQPLPYASIASQKNHIGIYLFCLYTAHEYIPWFQKEWKKTGKRLDMGKSCIRVKKLEDIPLDLVGAAIGRQTVQEFIDHYESAFVNSETRRRPARKAAAKKKVVKKAAVRTTKKKVARKAGR